MMEQLSLKEIQRATGAKFLSGEGAEDIIVRGISTDSRTTKRGDLFVALKGPIYDGHKFVNEAFAKGAIAALVSRSVRFSHPLLMVEDTLSALGDIAAWYRQKFSLTVIGITGSNGKTTTKEMMAKVLRQKYRLISSPASFNNFIGVPLTLFKVTSQTDALIQEMETNIPGGIRRLCKIARPYIGVVTNIGLTHLESLKTIKGVFKEKAELIESLPSSGVSILNVDDEYFPKFKKLTRGKRTITFGIKNRADFQAKDVFFKKGHFHFRINRTSFVLPTFFYKNIYNALAAVGVSCGVMGLKMKDAASCLVRFKFLPLRAQVVKMNGIKIINDCFNANPSSVEAALLSFYMVPAKRRFIILGDMLELGEEARTLHFRTGEFVGRRRVDYLICVGSLSRHIAEGASSAGLPRERIICCKTHIQAVKFLTKELKAKDVLLIKGSRAMQLEKIAEMLKGNK